MIAGSVAAAVRRLGRLSLGEALVLAEAVAAVSLGRLAVRILRFPVLVRLGERGQPRRGAAADARTARRLDRIGWAVRAAARRAPFRAMCFEQGIAARLMLGRRGIPSTLFYGVRRDAQGGFVAHVWVRAGEHDVVGCEARETFSILTRHPNETPSG